jgi:hypothetical protein
VQLAPLATTKNLSLVAQLCDLTLEVCLYVLLSAKIIVTVSGVAVTTASNLFFLFRMDCHQLCGPAGMTMDSYCILHSKAAGDDLIYHGP